MKKITYLIIATLLVFISCKTSKAQNTSAYSNKHFTVKQAYYKQWNGGQPGIKGVTITIVTDNPAIVLDSIYFRNTKNILDLNNLEKRTSYRCTIVLQNAPDYVLDSQLKNEYGNPVPDITKNIPFNLKQNEAVISYKIKNTVFYKKIELEKKM